jgi:hypothetical protein
MNAIAVTMISVAIATALCATAQAADDEQIKALESRFAAAFNAKDVESIMKAYAPDKSLVVFDVVPPRQYVGAYAYRKDFEGFLGCSRVRPNSRSPASASPVTARSAMAIPSSISWEPAVRISQSISPCSSRMYIGRSTANG